MVIRSKLFQSLFRRLIIRSSEVPNWGVVNKATNIKSSNLMDKYWHLVNRIKAAGTTAQVAARVYQGRMAPYDIK